MSPLPLRMLTNRVVFFSVFLPLISFSQVKIKEKVEVFPKAQSTVAEKSEQRARTAAGADMFFNPPLFVSNPIWNQTRLALPSTLTISGSITIGGDILGNQHTKLLDVGPWGQEHPIAWKGKAGWAGVPYSGESPYTGTFSAGSYPDVRLYLFDYKWTDGVRTMTFSENSLKYDFTGLLYQGHYTPPVPVTATATASGSILPEARFDQWQLGAPPMFVTGRDSVQVSIAPLDGNGNWYGPWGISPAYVEVTLRVDASGSHAYLAFMETRFDWDTEEFVVVQYKSGREINIPLAAGDGSWEQEIQTFLVYNDSMGTFDGLTETVQITITGGGKSKTIPVVITKEVICAQVAFNPPKLAPGETATLEFRKEDGTAFDADVKFDVMILDGGTNRGSLQSSSGIGVILSKTQAPVTYLAPVTIEGDSISVQVAAYAYTPAGGGGGGGDVTTALAKGSTIQKKAPRRIAAQTMALHSDRLVLERIGKLMTNNQCAAGQAVVKNEKPALVILEPLVSSITEKISSAPTMPTLNLKAQLKNFNKGKVEYHWIFYTRWIGPDGRVFLDAFDGSTDSRNSEVATWQVGWGGKTRGGDDLTVFVLAIADGMSYEAQIKNLGTVKGLNPSVAEVKAGLSMQEQVVVYLESLPKWKHFGADKYPIFGTPHGYGLMQLDNPRATDEQVWNWRENRAAGKARLENKLSGSRRYASDINNGTAWRDQPAPIEWYQRNGKPVKYAKVTELTTDEQLWKDAFHRYRGGVYWRWKPEDPDDLNSSGSWVASPTKGHKRGTEGWNLYSQVLKGNVPNGWNE